MEKLLFATGALLIAVPFGLIGAFIGWIIGASLVSDTEPVLYVKLAVAAGAILGALAPFFGPALLDRIQGDIARGTGDRDDTHGSARYATRDEIAELTKGSGLIIGRENRESGKLLRYDGPAHLLTLAPTRSGKGVGAILPNLLTADRSIICVDPKGENAKISHAARSKIGPVYVLDPFEVSGHNSAAYNPLSFLDEYSPDLLEDATTLADALVTDPPGQTKEAHWNEEAKALITGIIMFVVCHEKADERTLNTVRDYLTLGPAKFAEFLELMTESTAANGLIRRAANRQLGKSDREGSAVLSTAQRHTHILDSARIDKVTKTTDFSFADLKDNHASVFLVLPPERLTAYSRWLRLLIGQSIQEIARSKSQPEPPILYLLDEFAALGYLQPIEQAMGLMAGYGMQLWPILQDIHQLRDTYGQRAGTFMSNAAVVQTFNTNDFETAKWISDVLGDETINFETEGMSEGGFSISGQKTSRKLMNPDEVMLLDAAKMLLMLQGKRPIIAGKVYHYVDKEFSALLTGS